MPHKALTENEWRDFIVKKLDDLHHSLVRRYAILVTCLVLWGIAIAVGEAHSHSASVQAKQSAEAARRATALIQVSRYNFVLEACRADNARNHNTKEQLRKEVDRQKRLTPALKEALEERRVSTDLLIDALAPMSHNCVAKAQAATRTG